MMETCKTCPAWTQDKNLRPIITAWPSTHDNFMVDIKGGWGVCLKSCNHDETPVDLSMHAFAIVEYDRGEVAYEADVITHETYACNQRPSEWPEG